MVETKAKQRTGIHLMFHGCHVEVCTPLIYVPLYKQDFLLDQQGKNLLINSSVFFCLFMALRLGFLSQTGSRKVVFFTLDSSQAVSGSYVANTGKD